MNKIVLLVVPLIGMPIGLIIFFKPAFCIELQKKFYALINWRIEPINMKKEIRNTRIMGLCILVASLTAIMYILFK